MTDTLTVLVRAVQELGAKIDAVADLVRSAPGRRTGRLMTAREACAHYRVGSNRFLRAVAAGQLPVIRRPGGGGFRDHTQLFDPVDLERLFGVGSGAGAGTPVRP